MLSHFHLYGEQRSSGVMGRRNGPTGLRDDDDDDEHAYLESIGRAHLEANKSSTARSLTVISSACCKFLTNFSSHQGASTTAPK